MQTTTANPSAIRLVIADDCAIFRDGFEALLKKQKEISIVGQAKDGKELIEVVQNEKPDVVVTDIKMPLMDGIEATRILTKAFPRLGVIALFMFEEESLILEMLGAGARGYLLKNTTKTEVIEAVKTVNVSGTFYCSTTTGKLTKLLAQKKAAPVPLQKALFSQKEMTIIKLICEEYSNKEIASRLNLSCRSVESTRERIQEKIGAKNMAGIIMYAIKHGIVKI